jgi:hypothetical protein
LAVAALTRASSCCVTTERFLDAGVTGELMAVSDAPPTSKELPAVRSRNKRRVFIVISFTWWVIESGLTLINAI